VVRLDLPGGGGYGMIKEGAELRGPDPSPSSDRSAADRASASEPGGDGERAQRAGGAAPEETAR
jgi:hypothetical protein